MKIIFFKLSKNVLFCFKNTKELIISPLNYYVKYKLEETLKLNDNLSLKEAC